jgi:hypothetical protein
MDGAGLQASTVFGIIAEEPVKPVPEIHFDILEKESNAHCRGHNHLYDVATASGVDI